MLHGPIGTFCVYTLLSVLQDEKLYCFINKSFSCSLEVRKKALNSGRFVHQRVSEKLYMKAY